MSKIYDGKLTAWLETEIDKILDPLIPPITKFYEGINEFEVKSRSPEHNNVRQRLVALTREYSEREHSDAYTKPVETVGPVDHGEDHE